MRPKGIIILTEPDLYQGQDREYFLTKERVLNRLFFFAQLTFQNVLGGGILVRLLNYCSLNSHSCGCPGCFPTVDDVVAAQHRYFEEGQIKHIHKAKQNAYPVDKTDFVNHVKTILEAAQLLSCYEHGKELAWDLVAFSQEEAQRFTQPA